MKETFGKRFQRYRKELGIKQEEIASKVNISPQAVSKWENDLSSPDISILPELADILHITLDELLGREVIKTEIVPLENRKDIQSMLLKIIAEDDEEKVKVNMPMALILAFLDGGTITMPSVNGKDVLSNIDFKNVVQLIEQGVVGTLLEVESSDGVHVRIVLE